MAKTVNTGSTLLLTAAAFLDRVDARTMADLASITGTRDQAAIATNPVLLACLRDAHGMLESACLKGGRYQPADLAALTGHSQGYLFRVLSWLACWFVWQHRENHPDGMKMPELARQALEDLAAGTAIFGFVETQEAGQPSSSEPTEAQLEVRDGLLARSRRYWGERGSLRNGLR